MASNLKLDHTVFADTGFFLAFFNPENEPERHREAKEILAWAQKHKVRIITNEMVLDEFLTLIVVRVGTHLKKKAATFVRSLYKKKPFEVIKQEHELFFDGLNRYETYEDKEWSLTDCASMEYMQKSNISQVLGADKHFRQAKFQVLLQ